jgi:CRP-like cAMP-binding protein
MHWKSHLPTFGILSDEDIAVLLTLGKEVRQEKGSILLREGLCEPYMYLIGQGMVRAFRDLPDQSITFYFGQEGDFVLSMRSYVAGLPGYEHVEVIESGVFLRFKVSEVKALFAENHALANWGRCLAEQELLRTEARLIARQVKSATERYKDLMQQHPDLLQRVALGHIASYLGITQVSLSRIRASI